MSTDYIDAEHTSLAVAQPQTEAPVALFGTNDPVDTIERAVRVADALKSVVRSKGLISNIQGKEYPQVEAWQTLAVMLGVSLVSEWSRKVEGGWEARCVVRSRDGQTIGAAEAQCTREESRWKNRDDYALRSMAQTRATSKAARSVLGFVMVLAGYQATPAEEMPDTTPPTASPKPSGERIPTKDELRALYHRACELDPSQARPGGLGAWVQDNIPGYKPSDAGFRAIKSALEVVIAAGPATAPEPSPSPAPAATPEPAPAPPQRAHAADAPITEETRKHLMAALRRIGIVSKADRLRYAAERGYIVASFAELTDRDGRALAEDATNAARCPACGRLDPNPHLAGCPEGADEPL